MVSFADKWNVPGSTEYVAEEPPDQVLRARTDPELRGYWLARDKDGQVCFVSNQNNADYLTISEDPDGIPTINYSDETTEFSYDQYNTIRVRRYS